jgi:hypothetical protein
MENNGVEILFVAKCLAWRMERPESRTVSISFTSYGLYAYLHGKDTVCEIAWAGSDNAGFETAVKKIEEREREGVCQSEKSEVQKSATSYDAEQDGITVGTSS